MVKNPEILSAFEKSLASAERPDYERNLKIAEALYREACLLGVFPLRDPLEGIETDIRLARAINVRTPA